MLQEVNWCLGMSGYEWCWVLVNDWGNGRGCSRRKDAENRSFAQRRDISLSESWIGKSRFWCFAKRRRSSLSKEIDVKFRGAKKSFAERRRNWQFADRTSASLSEGANSCHGQRVLYVRFWVKLRLESGFSCQLVAMMLEGIIMLAMGD